jgi:hypothetical protein
MAARAMDLEHGGSGGDDRGRSQEPALAAKLGAFLDELIWHTRSMALVKEADAVGPARP